MGFDPLEGLPPNLALGIVLEKSNAVGDQDAENLHPTPRQYALGPGDWAITAGSNTDLDQNLQLVHLVDPADHAEEFPDWEDRVMGVDRPAHVLGYWYDKLRGEEPIEGLGWFPRVKLIPITEEQQQLFWEWTHEGDFPDTMPEWMEELFRTHTDELAKASPGEVPRFVRCGECGGGKVILQLRHDITWSIPAGEVVEDGQIKYCPAGQHATDQSKSARLHCIDCHASMELGPEELRLDKRFFSGVTLSH